MSFGPVNGGSIAPMSPQVMRPQMQQPISGGFAPNLQQTPEQVMAQRAAENARRQQAGIPLLGATPPGGQVVPGMSVSMAGAQGLSQPSGLLGRGGCR